MLELQFILTYSGTDYTVEEPDGFKTFNSVLERDFDTHGAFFRFTDSDLKLKFIGEGREVFRSARDGFGIDANVGLTVKRRYRSTDTFTTIYTGTAIMENLVIDQDFASVDFEEISLMTKIKDRLDVPISANATTDLDGNAISAATVTDFTMGAKTIEKVVSALISASDTATIENDGGTIEFIPTLPSSTDFIFDVVKEEVDNAFDGTESSVTSSSLNFGGRLYALPGSGLYSADVAVSGILYVDKPSFGTGAGIITVYLVEGFALPSGEDFLFSEIETSIGTLDLSAYTSIQTISFNISYTVTKTIATIARYYRLRIGLSGGGGTSQNYTLQTTNAGITTLTMTVTATTAEPETDVSGYFIHEALRHNVLAVGGTNSLYAPFIGRTADGYDSDGCAAYYTETNGWKLRGFTNAVQSSLKKRLNGLKNIFGLGYGVERSAAGSDTYRFRLDTYNYWYNDNLLLELDEDLIEGYSEEFYDWFNFNEVETGYEKHANDEDQAGSTEDFNSEATWLIPVDKLRGKKSFKSGYIASDLLAEVVRRIQFSKKPTTSNKYDDDLFINEVESDGGGGWEIGTSKVVADDGNVNPLFNVLINPKFNLFNHYPLINSVTWRKPINKSYKNTTFKNGGDLKIFYGSIGASSNCLGDLNQVSQSLPNLAPTLNDDITISNLRSAERLFDPIKISFKTSLTTDQVDDLVEAHRNGKANSYTIQMGAGTGSYTVGTTVTESVSGYTGTVISYDDTTKILVVELTYPTEEFTVGRALSYSSTFRYITTITENNPNNGYIRLVNPDGETVEGWLLRLTFNYADQIGNFELIKKAETYSI